MPRPHILLQHYGLVHPDTVLDPRYHPLGQPGRKIRGTQWMAKIPKGLGLPLVLASCCITSMGFYRWLYPWGPRTIHNVRIPLYDEQYIEYTWDNMFKAQENIFNNGHIYAAMQEKRILEAKADGRLPPDAPVHPTIEKVLE